MIWCGRTFAALKLAPPQHPNELMLLGHYVVRMLIAVTCGAALALTLRGHAFSMLSPVFLAMWLSTSKGRPCCEMVPVWLVSGMTFYGFAFEGILGSAGGAFGAVWMGLTLTFAAFHTAVFVAIRRALRSVGNVPTIMLAPGLVLHEYFRHLVVAWYDGAGLTICLLGQSFASNDHLLQSASLWGAWGLSFSVGVVTAGVMAWLNRGIQRKERLLTSAFSIAVVVLMIAYGEWKMRNPFPVTHDSVVTTESSLVPSLVDRVEAAVAQSSLATGTHCLVVTSETIAAINIDPNGKFDFTDENSILFLREMRESQCDWLVGTWITTPNRSERINALVQIDHGEIVAARPKQFLAPFVESRPIGTDAMVQMSWIPSWAIRDAMSPSEAAAALERCDRPKRIAASVCYDIFFSETFRDQPSGRLLTCSLDETFDDARVFQRLSAVHSKIRAVEFHRSLVRCSRGGITGAFDGRGIAIAPVADRDSIRIFEAPVYEDATLFQSWGNWIVWFSLVWCCLFLFFRCTRRDRFRSATQSRIRDA